VEPKRARLALADGRIFTGIAMGADGSVTAEVVFTTSMSGYQEILSDPSYSGQIVVMTASEIGNVGANRDDMESEGLRAAGLVVRSSRPRPSSWRATESLRELLHRQGVVAMEDVDTRALVLHIRDHGAQMAVLTTTDEDDDVLVRRAREAPGMSGRDLAKGAMTTATVDWTEGPHALQALGVRPQGLDFGVGYAGALPRPRIVALDFGMKRSILARLVEAGADVRVMPGTSSAEQVLEARPDGVFWSNGPGDPEPVSYGIETARKLAGRLPMFGICLGHQILGLAYGASSFKLKFGHRGGNQPVRGADGRVRITSQNHGFAIDPDSLVRGGKARPTEFNLNDQTLEAFEVPEDEVLAIQYHPEASPGPHDATDHFRRFVRLAAERRTQ